jgi:nicotinate-nucleotide adenylyltransferase
MQPIGIFGGSFDPVHYGHLRSALELTELLRLQELRWIPCGTPPHRATACASAELRLEMLSVAIQGESRFVIDDRELIRSGPSYTVDTLTELRELFPDQPLCLCVGMDAFAGLPTWHRSTEIFDLAHVVVAHRPGWKPPADREISDLLQGRETVEVNDLHNSAAGCIFVHEVTQLEISSSSIRAGIAEGNDPGYLLPPAVGKIIQQHHCYNKSQSAAGSTG